MILKRKNCNSRVTPEIHFSILSLIVVLSIILIFTPATAYETLYIPESSINTIFSKKDDSNSKLRLGTFTEPTQESIANLHNAISDTTHSFTYNKTTGICSVYNHAQKTRLTTTDDGIRISAPDGDIEFELVMIGHEDQLTPIDKSAISADGRTLRISGSGYSEWYRNNDNSIMQGIDITDRPEGNGNLVVQFKLSGNLEPSLKNQILTFSGETGQVLRYSNLHAWDSTGRELNIFMNLSGNLLAWIVDDRYAIYPVTIDPEFTLEQSDHGSIPDGNFGYSVAVSGDYALVGEIGNDTIRTGGVNGAGAAYFFKTSNNGESWILKQVVYGTVEDGCFGHSVSLSGDYATIGEFQNATTRGGGVTKAGAVYFYKTPDNGETWTLKQAEYGTVAFGGLGYSVSISGDRAMVGEYYDDTIRAGVVNGAGAVYFYRTSDDGETWTLKQAEYGTIPFGRFGSSVSVSGDYAVIGERYNDTLRAAVVNGAGAAHFYKTYDNGETWILKQSKYGSIVEGCLGNSVSISTDYAVIGEYGNDTLQALSIDKAGATYFYKTSDNGESWTMNQAEYGTIENGLLGCSVYMYEDSAIIGEYGNDTIRAGGVNGAGAVYFYKTSDNGETWIINQAEYGTVADGGLGHSVSFYEDSAMIGEYGNDTIRPGGVNRAGAAYFYLLRPKIDSYTPTNGSVNVPVNSNLVARFDMNIAAVGGEKVRIYRDDGTMVQAIDSDDASINGNIVTINSGDYSYDTGYYVKIDSGAFKSSARDTPFAGITDEITWTFTTTAQPSPDVREGESGDNGVSGYTNIGVTSGIKAGDTAKIAIKGDETAVKRVDIMVNKREPSAMVIVKKLNHLPLNIIKPNSKHYQYLDIKLLKVEPENVESATIHFSVQKSWLEGIEANPKDMVLKHYNEKTEEWVNLPTEIEKNTDEYIHYKAITPGFSYFLISNRGKSPRSALVTPVSFRKQSPNPTLLREVPV